MGQSAHFFTYLSLLADFLSFFAKCYTQSAGKVRGNAAKTNFYTFIIYIYITALKVRAKHHTRCAAFLLRILLHHSELLVFAHFLLEKVRLAFQGNEVHERERILRVVDLDNFFLSVQYNVILRIGFSILI